MTDLEQDFSKPDWLVVEQDQNEPPAGALVQPAIQKIRGTVAARDVIELCVGNIFSVFLVLLAPFFKSITDSMANTKQNNSSD